MQVTPSEESGVGTLFPVCHIVQDSQERMMLLLNFHYFAEEDMRLNANVLQWPDRMMPVFNENEQVCVSVV